MANNFASLYLSPLICVAVCVGLEVGLIVVISNSWLVDIQNWYLNYVRYLPQDD